MADLDEFEIDRSTGDEDPPLLSSGGPQGDFPVGFALAAVVGIAALGAIGYYALRRPAVAPPSPAPAVSAAPETQAPAPVATPTPTPSAEAIKLPPLDQSDALVRKLAASLSSHPQLALWLAQEGLVARLTVVAENVAAGANPRTHLGFLTPRRRFQVVTRNDRLVADPRSYEGYDAFADGVASLDATACARVYRLLEPLFDAAYRDLGHPDSRFRVILAATLARLSKVPVLTEDAPLRPVVKPILLYQYEDPRLEALSIPQKLFLRTGPRNVAKVQAKLRELDGALALSATGPPPARGSASPPAAPR
jgi:hypothetical protein